MECSEHCGSAGNSACASVVFAEVTLAASGSAQTTKNTVAGTKTASTSFDLLRC